MGGERLTSEFAWELKRQMDLMGGKNGLNPRGRFISDDFLQLLFTPENLRQRLQDFESVLSKRVQYEEFIKKRAKRVYAILILLDESSRILEFKEGGVDDARLFGVSEDDFSKCFCTKEKLREIPQLEGLVDKFYEMQWVFPPTLSSTETLFFDAKFFRFPFTTEPKWIGCGAIGHVYEVEIGPGYIKPSNYFQAVSILSVEPILRELLSLIRKGYESCIQENQKRRLW